MILMEEKEVIALVFPTVIAILGVVTFRLKAKWKEGDVIRQDMETFKGEFIFFKETQTLKVSSIESQVSSERQERIQSMVMLENRLYDLLSDFKKDVKDDISEMQRVMEKNQRSDIEWKDKISEQLNQIIIETYRKKEDNRNENE